MADKVLARLQVATDQALIRQGRPPHFAPPPRPDDDPDISKRPDIAALLRNSVRRHPRF